VRFSTLILFFASSSIVCAFDFQPNSDSAKLTKDTIYYLSFLDLVEKEGHIGGQNEKLEQYKGGRLITDYDLTGERKVMNKTIKKLLKNKFTLIPVPDSCYKNFSVDSVSRRKREFVMNICRKCAIDKPLIILDAVWEYLNENSFYGLQLKYRNSPRSASYWIIGTWWDVHVFVYTPKEEIVTIHINRNFSQWSNARPRPKWWPGLMHTRFYERPIREVRKLLQKSD
jgi:hypothetical protein